MTLRIALNATAYDELPSGSRARSIGLAASLMRYGCTIWMVVPKGLSLKSAVEYELGGPTPAGRYFEITAPMDPRKPLDRAFNARRWFVKHLPSQLDLFLTDYYPVLKDTPTGVTVHDLRYLAAPQFESAGRVTVFRVFYKRLVSQAPMIVVPTAAVASDVEEYLGIHPPRIVVSGNGLSRRWLEAEPPTGARKHLLCIGGAEPRKDVGTLIKAMMIARTSGTVLPLKIVGRTSDHVTKLMASAGAAELAKKGLIEHVGVVSEEELIQLARDAAALLHASCYEGFGMPVVEALWLGLPVFAADVPAVAEVAGDQAYLMAPGDPAAWAEAISYASNGARPKESRREWAGQFTWDRAAYTLLTGAFGEDFASQ